ncbi:beta-ketoacyl-[acyl-carrier-protein] synthase family protein [Streptomyces anthocyanicus]|uniref:beta-ketoacyl-[acyl-carrier-protein] synthase family protein n=1 Tax=Streptomyces TaxID=1883 RepID=UPI0029AF5977|nr:MULTISPECIES: beta-ketoacyl-[acyl-carrier-protein] synthase family protein [Streptomyces]MDX3319085.1 beta-ketoacyl-[acyl-carrier-protein] synthase family protein [Streptomyces sp. ME03-5684b]MDX3348740.1 beta-ketoacyl-[acyl-carrier-protein] synthase family protein [Streptomyces sp. ME02-6979A]WSB60334.1 beta-ketoacyl-[acyl-carrier-protein] synthase family protein [Streptomyces anthocyanicus]WTC11723.1 beta-ketoacyl-[acyl-carrier-protein] synthase family protein [Streptomyces anthocyanicus]
MTDPSLAVTGLGLVTAAGMGVDATWEGVLRGRSAGARDERLAGLPVDIACAVPGLQPARHVDRRSVLIHDRFVQLAIVAAREAVADAGLDPLTWDGARVGVVVGCGLGGVTTWETQHRRLLERGPEAVSALLVPMLVPNMAAGHLAMDLRALGPNLVTATACASGGTALGTAARLLRDGTCDIVVAGGTEAGVSPLMVTGFAQMGALSRRVDDPAAASRPFDADRDGFVIGEGSGMLVLERAADAEARGATVRARLLGHGASADAHHVTAPDPEGAGALRAMEAALAQAGVTGRDIDHVNAHGTSTPLNDAVEAAVLGRLLGDRATVTSAKGVLGHTLGAAGAIEAALTVLSIERSTVPPTANLRRQDPAVDLDVVADAPREQKVELAMSNSFGFGGQNAVLVFASP